MPLVINNQAPCAGLLHIFTKALATDEALVVRGLVYLHTITPQSNCTPSLYIQRHNETRALTLVPTTFPTRLPLFLFTVDVALSSVTPNADDWWYLRAPGTDRVVSLTTTFDRATRSGVPRPVELWTFLGARSTYAG